MNRTPSRAGAVLVVSMVCLLIVTALIATMISGTLQRRLHLRKLHDVRQAELLLVAGYERALAQLSRDDSYDGESWEPVVNGSGSVATVEITMTADDDSQQFTNVAVTYVPDSPRTVRRSGRFLISPTSSNNEESKND
ncbi:MAG: hypothetical protein AAGF31_06655 [Planctomycetota bacterium]